MPDAITKHAGGRPSKYDPAIAAQVCEQLALGRPLTKIVPEVGVGLASVYRWMVDHPEFRESYARAREDQADTYADEIVAIADEDPQIVFEESRKDGAEGAVYRVDSAAVSHQKNRVDARKWVASKLKPKTYGEKTQLEHSGAVATAPSDPAAIVQQLVAMGTQHPTLNPVIRQMALDILTQLPEIPS